MTNSKDLILALKKVKKEKNLSLNTILQMIEDNGEFVSKTTLSRIFAKGSEEQQFRYETTLKPIANAILDVENIEFDDDVEVRAVKSLLVLKKELIDELEGKLKTIGSEEKQKYHDKLDRELAKYQKSLDFAMSQIALKDKRIDMLMEDNHLLLSQLMSCPCRKDGKKNG